MTRSKNGTSLAVGLVVALLAAPVSVAPVSAAPEVQDIACDETPFRMNFRGMTCEAVLAAPTEDGLGHLDYYGVFGEFGTRFRNVELAVAGPQAYVDPARAQGLKTLLQTRFSWLRKARNWSAEQATDGIDYLTFDLPFGACAGFITYAEPLSRGFKLALNGVFCRKSGRTYDLEDLREALSEVRYGFD